MRRRIASPPIALLCLSLLLAGCGEDAAPEGETAAAAERPLIAVETPVRSPGALAEAEAAAEGPPVEILRPEEPEPEPELAPAPAEEAAAADRPAAEEAAPATAAAEPAALLAVLPVRDVDAAVAFYRDGLGFTRAEGDLSGEVVLERGATRIALRRTDEGVAPRSGASGWNVPRSGVVLRLDVDDLAAVRESLRDAGLTPRRARGGGVAVLDPAGHLVVVSGS